MAPDTTVAKIPTSSQTVGQLIEGGRIDTVYGDVYMHQAMAATLEHCVLEIRRFQEEARRSGRAFRPRWPVVILRSPKGWTAPRKVDGHYLEGFWRAHQIPLADVATNAGHLNVLENWMRSYEPEKLFDREGRLIPELRAIAPKGSRRMSANPTANGGLLRKPLDMPDFCKLAIDVKKRGATEAGNVPTLGNFLREVMRQNMNSFRVFGPDETESNQLQAIYEVAKKVWLGAYFPEDADGGQLAAEGRVMEMLSEHTVEGWLEGYVLTGRHVGNSNSAAQRQSSTLLRTSSGRREHLYENLSVLYGALR